MHHHVPPQIPGQQIPHQDAEFLRVAVADLLARENKRFPGAQPVSFAKEHLQELQRAEYFMCEKTDGIRCLLFLFFSEDPNTGAFVPNTFLIDRKNNYYHVTPPLHFPYYQMPQDRDKFLFNTILDGELVHDTVPGQPKPRLIFYVFDVLVIDGENFTQKPLDKRLGYMGERVFKPYERLRQQIPPEQLPPEPFRVKRKEVHSPYHINDMFRHILPNLPHGNDGLVFTCKTTAYKFGTDDHILKWKPPQENTIDFKLRLGDFPLYDPEDEEEGLIPDYDAMPDRFMLLVMHDKNNYQPFTHDLYVTEQDWETLKGLNQYLDGRIIECFRDDQGRWRYKREEDGTPRWRDDKKDANHISTVDSVLESIEDPVTEQDLIASEGRIKAAVQQLRQREADEKKVRDMQMMEMEREAKKRKFSEVNGGSH